MLSWTRIDWSMQMSVSSRGEDKKPPVNNYEKTGQAIMTFYQMYKEGKAKKLLILAKKAIKKQWLDEFKKFTDIVDLVEKAMYIPESITPKKRHQLYEEYEQLESGILISTYQSTYKEYDLINKVGFDMVIIDEAHNLRAVEGKMNNNIKKIVEKTKYKLLLTGTPVMARPADMYALINLCTDAKKYFGIKKGGFKAFKDKYIFYITRGFGRRSFDIVLGYRELDDLREKCQNVLIRRTEHEVDIELPDTINSKIELTPDNVQLKIIGAIQEKEHRFKMDLDRAEMRLKSNPYNFQYKRAYDMISDAMKGLISCKQAVANDPRLLLNAKSRIVSEFATLVPESYKGSDKTDYVTELCSTVLEEGRKILIFSKFERSLWLLKEHIEKELKVNVLLYYGQLSEKQRNIAIDTFRDSTDYNILIGTESLSEGVNLAESNTIVNFDLPDTNAIRTQRMGRARRASSRYKSVYVYDCITKGTVDVTILNKLKNQKDLFGSMVELNEEESKAIKLSNN